MSPTEISTADVIVIVIGIPTSEIIYVTVQIIINAIVGNFAPIIPAVCLHVCMRKAETIVALWDACRKANPKVLMTTGKVPKAKQSNPELQAIRSREHVAIGERIQFYRDALVKREGAALAEATKQAGMLAGKSEDQIAAEAKAEDEKKWEKQFVAAMTSWEKKFQGATDSRFVPLATLVAHCRKACEATLNPPKAEKPATKRKAK
jgi:hypothetical protein